VKYAELPDGTQLEFPDDTPDAIMDRTVKLHVSGMAPKEPSTGADVAKSVASAPFKGAANLVGLPSTVLDLAAMGAGKVAPSFAGALKPELPNIGDLARRGFESLGLMHKPETTAGRYAGGAVEGAFSAPGSPSMMLSGLGAGTGAEAGRDVGGAYGFPNLGAFIGSILGGTAVNKLVQPIQSNLNAEQKAIVEAAKERGMKLTPGQQTGNRRMLAFESATEQMPGGGMLAKQRADNLRKANEIALKSIGEKGSDISPEVLSNAANRIGAEFDRLTKGRQIKLDQQFFDDVKAIAREQAKLAEPDPAVMATLNKWAAPSGAKNVSIPSDVYQANRSAYSAEMRQAFGGQTSQQAARAKQALVKALDKAAERSLPMKDLKDFKTARQQWANLEALEAGDLARSGYNVNPNQLANALRQQNKKMGRIPLGERELVDLSRMGSLLRDVTPNSGTAERAMWSALLTGGGAYGGGALGGPLGAATGIGLSFAAPAAAQRMIMAPGVNQYLSSGLLPGFEQTAMQPALLRALELSEP